MAKTWPPQNTGVFSPPSCVYCCNETPVDFFEYRSNVAPVALMCGFAVNSEGDPFTYHYYRTKTWSGSLSYEYFDDGCDQPSTSTGSDSFSGSSTLGYVGTGCGTLSDTLSINGIPQGNSGIFGSSVPGDVGSYDVVSSPTSTTISGTGDCIPFAGTNLTVTGSANETLSDEFTETDATDYCDAQGFLPDWQPFAIYAVYQQDDNHTPVDGFSFSSFDYIRVKWRYTKNGLLPNTDYQLSVDYERATSDISGMGSFSTYATAVETGTTDATGKLVLAEIEIPFARGYATRINESSKVLIVAP